VVWEVVKLQVYGAVRRKRVLAMLGAAPWRVSLNIWAAKIGQTPDQCFKPTATDAASIKMGLTGNIEHQNC